MLSETLAWKYVLPLFVAVALAGGVIGGTLVHFATGDDESDESGLSRGSVVELGPPDSLYGNPFCIEAQHLCVSQLEDGRIVALYMYDTHPLFRTQNCAVTWRPEMSFTDPVSGEETTGWFRSGCSGATFRLSGERVFGPAPRDLDRFEIKVLGSDGRLAGYLEVDTRHLICGDDHGNGDNGCDFAPLPQ